MIESRRKSHLVLLALVACVGFQNGSPVTDGQVELDCVIQPSRVVEISAGVLNGVLSEIHVDRGDFVQEGQLLAVLDSRLEEATLRLARARVDFVASLEAARATRDYYSSALERANNLFDESLLSDELQEQAQQDAIIAENRLRVEEEAHELARLELDRAEVALEMRQLVSPIDGVVTDRLVEPGEFVGQATILTLARLDPLYVEIVAPASLYGSIEVGSTAVVMPGDPVGGTYPAEVTVVDRVLDAASNTFRIRLELPNPDYALPAGLRGRALLSVDPSQTEQ